MQIVLESTKPIMTPKTIVEEKQQINYHATRILLLIAFAGSPKNTPMIKGRTLLAKFDFFLRYPAYLGRAVKIRTGRELEDLLDYEINNSCYAVAACRESSDFNFCSSWKATCKAEKYNWFFSW